jgi:hypothetical protein
LAIYPSNGKAIIKTLELTEKQQEFSFPFDSAPESIILDPDNWVLMDGKWEKK